MIFNYSNIDKNVNIVFGIRFTFFVLYSTLNKYIIVLVHDLVLTAYNHS